MFYLSRSFLFSLKVVSNQLHLGARQFLGTGEDERSESLDVLSQKAQREEDQKINGIRLSFYVIMPCISFPLQSLLMLPACSIWGPNLMKMTYIYSQFHLLLGEFTWLSDENYLSSISFVPNLSSLLLFHQANYFLSISGLKIMN